MHRLRFSVRSPQGIFTNLRDFQKRVHRVEATRFRRRRSSRVPGVRWRQRWEVLLPVAVTTLFLFLSSMPSFGLRRSRSPTVPRSPTRTMAARCPRCSLHRRPSTPLPAPSTTTRLFLQETKRAGPVGMLDSSICFILLEGRSGYMQHLDKLYTKHVAWFTPVELFKPRYAYAIAASILRTTIR